MGYTGSHATGSYLVYIPETKRFVVSRNVKFNEGKCDDVIRAAQATIARMEEFEEGAAQMRRMVDHHTSSRPNEPPLNELSRAPPDHPRSSEEIIDQINPETGTSEEIQQAGQTAVAAAKFVKKKPAKKKKNTVKLHLKDKLVWTRKTAKSPYINARCEAMDELTVEEALTRMYKDAEGVSVAVQEG